MPIEVDRDQRHRAVVTTARRLIVQGGLPAVTFRNLARELKCSTMAISYYFPTMQDVLLETYRYTALSTRERREARIDHTADPVDFFEEILPVGPERFEDWKVWLCFWTSALFVPALAREQKERTDATRDQIARVLVRAGFDEERARRRARAVMTAIFGIAVQAIFDPQDWPSDAQRQALRQALSAIEEADATRA